MVVSKSWKRIEDLNYEVPDVSPVDPPKYPNMDKLWPRWHLRANCLGVVDDTLFFGKPQPGVYAASAIKEAKRYCADCPVFRECLTHALTEREPWGVWASTTMRERQAIIDGLDTGLFTMDEIIADRMEARDEFRTSEQQQQRSAPDDLSGEDQRQEHRPTG